MTKEVLARISIIVPSLNPDEKLKNTINSLKDVGFTDIICVNDGSNKECLSFFPGDGDGVVLLKHDINRGKGAALRTAFAYLKENRPDSIGAVTVDGDGQHAAKDVLHAAEVMAESGDSIVLGCRDFSGNDVPSRSKMGNKITSGVFKVLCGMKISDTQTGLRAFPAKYYQDMLEVSGDRFEYETNMLLEMKARKIKYTEIKIETVYIEENRTSHFRPIKDSFRIYSLIFKFTLGQFAKFFLSSIASCVIDTSLIFLFLYLSQSVFKVNLSVDDVNKAIAIAAAQALARLISSIFNFAVNRKYVFKANTPLKNDLIKYYSVAIPILITSLAVTSLLEHIPMFNSSFMITLLALAVNCTLYLLSYLLQKKWVFKKIK